jgi:CheY-like chemotaxis protein
LTIFRRKFGGGELASSAARDGVQGTSYVPNGASPNGIIADPDAKSAPAPIAASSVAGVFKPSISAFTRSFFAAILLLFMTILSLPKLTGVFGGQCCCLFCRLSEPQSGCAHSRGNGSRGARAMGSLAGKKILIVDDNPINLDIAAETLLLSGADVDSAGGGEDALALIDKQKYDLVLLDLTMPDVDGLEVGRKLRSSEKNAKTALLLFTASDASDAQRAARELNAQGLVSKPVDVDDLTRKVAQHA